MNSIMNIMKLNLSVVLIVISPFLFAQEANTENVNDYMHRNRFESLVNSFESASRLEWQKPDDVIVLFGDLSGKTIQDIGAGTGYFVFRLAKTAEKVIAADVDERFMELANYRLDTMTDELLKAKIKVRKIPYDNPGLSPEEVDGVLLVNTYHHIEDRVSYMKKIRKGVRKGGRILIVDFYKNTDFGPPSHHKLAKEVVIAELTKAGFSEIKINAELLE